jgi:hypothetical protein
MRLSEVLGRKIRGWKAGCPAVERRRILATMGTLQRKHCYETAGKRTWPQMFINTFGIIDHSLRIGSKTLSLSHASLEATWTEVTKQIHVVMSFTIKVLAIT